MRRNILLPSIVLAGLAWLLVIPGMAFGQGNTWVGANLRQMIESARWRLGLFRVNAAFELSNVGYNSDIYHGYLGERVPDYVFSASTPVQVLVPVSKKVVLDFSDSPQYVFYLDTQRERTWNNTFHGQVHIALERFYIQAGGGMSDIRQRFSHELDLNIRSKQNKLNGLVLWQAGKGTSFALLFGTAKYDLGNAELDGTSLAERLNRKEDSLDFITYVQPTARIRLSLDGQYGTYRFTKDVSGLRDAKSYSLFAGIEFVPGVEDLGEAVNIQGNITLGYKRIDMLAAQFIDGSGFVGEAGIMAGLSKRTTGRVFYSRGFEFSIFSGSSYYLSTSYGAGISRLLSRKASLSYDISFGRSSYPGFEPDGGVTPQGRYYRYMTHDVSLNVRLARHLGMTFLGTYGRRAVESGLARKHAFIGFNLVYGFAGGGMSAPVSGGSR